MKKHLGMRPQDIVILLKIAAKGQQSWLMKDLAGELRISSGEVSESLYRSALAGLISADKRHLQSEVLLNFLIHGLPYVFPQKPGAMIRGLPTAHAAPPLNDVISGEEVYVWPWSKGTVRGQAVEPLYPTVPEAAFNDREFYELLALCDALRLGKARERRLAAEELRERL